MGLRALPLTPPHANFLPNTGVAQSSNHGFNSKRPKFRVLAKQDKGNTKEEPKKQSLFSSVTEALDFSQVRSAQDAELLEEARQATSSGERMSREQVCQIKGLYIYMYLFTIQMCQLSICLYGFVCEFAKWVFLVYV